MRVVKREVIKILHAIRSFCQDVNHKLFVLRLLSSHITIRVHDRLDIVLNVFLLSALVV